MKSDKQSSSEEAQTAFRNALGRFATGVAVATTRSATGVKSGITISSFNSVSLDPPLVLWSIARSAHSFDEFSSARHFAVNVLTESQAALSERFAEKNGNKFQDLDCPDGLNGVPLLPDFAACFECSTEHRYEGGDHLIIVGRVHNFEVRDADPLLYFGGGYFKKGEPLS